MRRALHRLRRFGDADDAVSTIEFCLVFPVLMLFTLAGGQVVLYVDATRKVQSIAVSASEMISQAVPPVGGNGTASVNSVDLDFAYDSTLVIFPYIMTDALARNIPWRQAITVSFAGISFIPVQGTNCTGLPDQSTCFTAHVDWTSTGTSSTSYRPCLIPQLPTDNTASYSRYFLPRSLFGPGSIIAVDVSYTFNPTFGSGLVSPLTVTRSVFVQPRYATSISFNSTGNDGIASTCLF